MNQFLELLEGTFSNKKQAQGHPTRYAHIWINHRKLSDDRIYGEQAYNYSKMRPYRQFVIDVVSEKGQFRLKNYEIENPTKYIGCKNLEEITDEVLTYRDGCDIIIKQSGPKVYTGGTSTCECYVNWSGQNTYLQNNIELTETQYKVIDSGFDVNTKQKVWGSQYGHLVFDRMGL